MRSGFAALLAGSLACLPLHGRAAPIEEAKHRSGLSFDGFRPFGDAPPAVRAASSGGRNAAQAPTTPGSAPQDASRPRRACGGSEPPPPDGERPGRGFGSRLLSVAKFLGTAAMSAALGTATALATAFLLVPDMPAFMGPLGIATGVGGALLSGYAVGRANRRRWWLSGAAALPAAALALGVVSQGWLVLAVPLALTLAGGAAARFLRKKG